MTHAHLDSVIDAFVSAETHASGWCPKPSGVLYLLYDFLRCLARPVDVPQYTLDQVKVHTSCDGHPQILQRPKEHAAPSPLFVHASHCRSMHLQLSKLKKTVADMTAAVKQMANVRAKPVANKACLGRYNKWVLATGLPEASAEGVDALNDDYT